MFQPLPVRLVQIVKRMALGIVGSVLGEELSISVGGWHEVHFAAPVDVDTFLNYEITVTVY